MKHFITTMDYSQANLQSMLDSAKEMKAAKNPPKRNGKVLTTIFFNPSLRTLLSFTTGMQKMGGICNVLDMSSSRKLEHKEGAIMNTDKSEHLKEFIQVICSYSDVIAIRKSDFIPDKNNVIAADSQTQEELLSDKFLEQVKQYTTKPLINMESNLYHPCQSLADMLTMQELLGNVEKKKYVLTWAPHPKPLPLATPHSQTITPCIFGMEVTVTCPEGFDLAPSILEHCQKLAETNGGSLHISNNQNKALQDADIVCAKSWMGLKWFGNWHAERVARNTHLDWQITSEKMAMTNDAKFMHCLPVRRNVVVNDAVLDSPQSVIIREAENRMWAQMGMLQYLLKQ